VSAPSSDTIRQLAVKAQVLGLPQQPHLSQSSRELLQQADQERRLLSSSEIQSLCQLSGVMAAPLEQLQAQAQPLVDQARHDLLEAQPHLVKPGGALYPEHRAEACWRDCFHFLRVCCYAVAVAQPKFTNPQGMAALGELYAALGVPVDGLLLALARLQELATKSYGDASAPSSDVELLDAAFCELRSQINRCVVTSC
tara:strand:+ start:53 stop:646 length:594 start_codon:yes stop_codon:yes gene_type:complete